VRRALKWAAIGAAAAAAVGTIAGVWAARSFYTALPLIFGWASLAGISWGLLSGFREPRHYWRARRWRRQERQFAEDVAAYVRDKETEDWL